MRRIVQHLSSCCRRLCTSTLWLQTANTMSCTCQHSCNRKSHENTRHLSHKRSSNTTSNLRMVLSKNSLFTSVRALGLCVLSYREHATASVRLLSQPLMQQEQYVAPTRYAITPRGPLACAVNARLALVTSAAAVSSSTILTRRCSLVKKVPRSLTTRTNHRRSSHPTHQSQPRSTQQLL